MTILSTPLIDSDRHVIEPNDIWKSYLPEKYHAYLPYFQDVETKTESGSVPHYMINGQAVFYKWNENLRLQKAIKMHSKRVGKVTGKAAHPKTQIESMDESNVDIAMLFPTYTPFIITNENLPDELACAFASAYNRWLNEYCQYDTRRLRGVGVICRHDPKEMLNELERIIKYGWQTIFLRPEKVRDRVLGHKDYEEFWSLCEVNNISIAFHGGTHVHADTAGSRHFDSHFAMHACAHPHEMQMAFLTLLESGVMERHPNLKFAFLESGASWLPSWLWRLDEVCYEPLAYEIQENVCMPPSEYFKRQCWIGMESREPCIRQVIEAVGSDSLLLGSDFPHPDHLHFSLEEVRKNRADFSEEEAEKIVHHNPSRFFNL